MVLARVVKAALTAVLVALTVATAAPREQSEEEIMTAKRLRMVETQIRKRGIKDPRVLGALETVPRHHFVPAEAIEYAYDDHPLRIGEGQTISQPYIVALMTETAALKPTDRVLEIGTGSGYQAAVLSMLVEAVYTIEIVEELGRAADNRLNGLGYDNVYVRIGDGYKGWPEKAPFDAILVTAAPDEVPPALIDQLAEGGRMVIPVGTNHQELLLLEKKDGVATRTTITAVRFVPMVHGDEED